MAETLEANGARLGFERGGAGPAVVFVHGLGGGGSWAAQRRAAEGVGFDATAIDLRGAGSSEVPPGPYSVELWAADVVAAIEALGIGSTALVGHSVGCMVAEHAALELGERCAALALLGGRPRWPPGAEEAFEQRAKLAEEGSLDQVMELVEQGALSERGRADPELVARFRDLFARNDPRGYAESARATGRGSMRDLDRLRCPLLAFAGSEDAVTVPAASEEIAAAARGRAAVVAGGAHWCQLELPDAVDDLLLGFLGSSVTG